MRPGCLKRSLPSDLDKVDVNFCHEAKFCGTFTASAAALSSYFASHYQICNPQMNDADKQNN